MIRAILGRTCTPIARPTGAAAALLAACLCFAPLALAAGTAKSAPPAKAALAKAVERVIVADSASWLFKVFKPGSVRDVAVETGDDPGTKIVSATYSYADDSSTWIKILVRDESVDCIEYGDEFFTGCRAVGDNPAIALIVEAVTAPASNDSAPRNGMDDYCRRFPERRICGGSQ